MTSSKSMLADRLDIWNKRSMVSGGDIIVNDWLRG